MYGVSGYFDWSYAGGTTKAQSFSADRFAGHTAATTNLSFFRNRAYDARTGRWTQEDPLGVAGGVNLYQFNHNNPVAFIDPFGLCPPEDPTRTDDCFGGGGGFGGGGAGGGVGSLAASSSGGSAAGLDVIALAAADAEQLYASELRGAALKAGWTEYQKNPTGPLKYRDDNGVDRLTLKKGSPRTPGSERPHAEFRDRAGRRVDTRGRPVTQKSVGNHTPIVWDLKESGAEQ